jgi:hypothetical protein
MIIIIPTLGRINDQITYNNIPEKYKKDTYLVAQVHEFDELDSIYKNKVLKLPENIKTIGPTRQWIHNKFKDNIYAQFDDDLTFTKRKIIVKYNVLDNYSKITESIHTIFTEVEFDESFNLIEEWFKLGFGAASFGNIRRIIDSIAFTENDILLRTHFFNGPIIKDININYIEAGWAEDIGITLQILTNGYPIRTSNIFLVESPKMNSNSGGCNITRTAEIHNKGELELQKMWPNYITLKYQYAEAFKDNIYLLDKFLGNTAFIDGVLKNRKI